MGLTEYIVKYIFVCWFVITGVSAIIIQMKVREIVDILKDERYDNTEL